MIYNTLTAILNDQSEEGDVEESILLAYLYYVSCCAFCLALLVVNIIYRVTLQMFG